MVFGKASMRTNGLGQRVNGFFESQAKTIVAEIRYPHSQPKKIILKFTILKQAHYEKTLSSERAEKGDLSDKASASRSFNDSTPFNTTADSQLPERFAVCW